MEKPKKLRDEILEAAHDAAEIIPNMVRYLNSTDGVAADEEMLEEDGQVRRLAKNEIIGTMQISRGAGK